ncbi:MAG TPA: LLM class flavin-dependent oxidoreductase [Pyrinomonadaceae bacterium]|jgi:luciferase family oxidoreductase group 1|nr:LLM class flavin-dependent oxidoreductase [Pyrinomonadaceae bacterium]
MSKKAIEGTSGIPISVLDLAPVKEGGTVSESFRDTLDLARHAERWGYRRFWLAEHHNIAGIASAATAVLIGYVAGGTKTIRVGSGGVMLPNHAPLVIAEQFGTLETLYPGRIDLGIGRAPGTDQLTMRALRRNLSNIIEDFPRDVAELLSYFAPARPGQMVCAVPGEGLRVPIWLLGSSLYSAQLAAMLGLPFAFASHFAPDLLIEALKIYRDEFQPSEALREPYAMPCVNVFAADTEREARRLFTSVQQAFINLRRNHPGLLPAPVDSMEGRWSEFERAGVERALRYSIVGSAETVRRGLEAFIDLTEADEIMVTAQIFDHPARLRSFNILAGVREMVQSSEQAVLPH